MPIELLESGEDPFKPAPDHRFLYFNDERRKTYDALIADIRGGRPCTLLIGGSGLGKTTLLGKLQQELDSSEFKVIYPSYTRLSYEDLLDSCRELGADGLGLDGWNEAVPEEVGTRKPLLILVDEAQVMTDEALVRLCQLCASEQSPSVQVLFAGQPELAERLEASETEAARACSKACHSLDRLDEVDTTAYIKHRLAVVGAQSEEVFDAGASERVARLAGGVPRLINRLSGTSLRMARDQDAETVSPDIVDLAAEICEPAPDVDGAVALFGDAGSEAPGAATDDKQESAGDDVLTLKVDLLAVEQEIEQAEKRSRERHRRETAATPGGRELAGARARQAPSRSSGLTLVLRGFLIGAAMGAAVMVGFLLTAVPDEESLLSRDRLAALWQNLQDGSLFESGPASGPALSAASNNPGSPPVIVASAASGPEDQPVALDIDVSHPAEIDPADVTVRVSSLPEGGALSAGIRQPDGSWRLTLADIAGVQFVPAPDFSGSLALEIAATARDRVGGNATIAFASTRLPITVVGVADPPRLEVSGGAGKAGEPIPLAIDAAATDLDGSESFTVELRGLPPGWLLSAGTLSDGGIWTLTPAELDGLTATPPPEALTDIEIEVQAVAVEVDGGRAVTTAGATLSVAPNLRKPDLQVGESAGEEDIPVALAIGIATEDVRGPEGVRVTLSGLPEGAALSAGTAEQEGIWRLGGNELEGLTLTPPAHFSGRFELSVEADVAGIGETAVSAILPVVVTPRADQPTLAVTPAEGLEDEAIPLAIAAETPDGDGSETLTIEVAGLPPGARLSRGEERADGAWSLRADQLDGLTVTPPPHFSGAMPLSVRATATEPDGGSAVAEAVLTVQVRGVADPPSLAAGSVSGVAGQAIPLSISAQSGDPDRSEKLSVELAGLPDGATLSHGEPGPGGTWLLGAEELAALVLTAEPGTSGRFTLTVTLYAEEAEGDTATAVAETTLILRTLKDLVLVEAADASGLEDSAIPLEISLAGAEEAGGPLSLLLSGLAEGAALSIGVEDDGARWRLEPEQLEGLQLLPPSDFSGTMAITVEAGLAFEEEAERPSALMTVDVEAVADAPELRVSEARGEAGTAIALAISASLSDLDGSERLSISVEGLPEGFALSAGRRAADGSWRLEPEDLGALALLPPADYGGRMEIDVVARAEESNDSYAETAATLPVIVDAIAAPVPEADPAEAAAPVETRAQQTRDGEGEDRVPAPALSAPSAETPPAPAAPANDWIARGDRLLSLGDIAAARLFYELAVQQGNAKAATAMGRTYDPAFLKEKKVIGVPGNPALAAEWYRRAAEAGDLEAQSLLQSDRSQP